MLAVSSVPNGLITPPVHHGHRHRRSTSTRSSTAELDDACAFELGPDRQPEATAFLGEQGDQIEALGHTRGQLGMHGIPGPVSGP